MGLRPMEVLLILIVVLLLFGTSRLPQLGQSLGSAIRNFKKGFQGEDPPPEATASKPPAALSSPASTQGTSSAQSTSASKT